jgi:hypothetical protein
MPAWKAGVFGADAGVVTVGLGSAPAQPVIRLVGPGSPKKTSLKMNLAGTGPWPWSMRNFYESLKTMPVGDEASTSSSSFSMSSCTPLAPRYS